MVRSPGPVSAGFGLDGGEVFARLVAVAYGLFDFSHYKHQGIYLSINLDVVSVSSALFSAANVFLHVLRRGYPRVAHFPCL